MDKKEEKMSDMSRIFKYRRDSEGGKRFVKAGTKKAKEEAIEKIKNCEGFIAFTKDGMEIETSGIFSTPLDVIIYMTAMQESVSKMMKAALEGQKPEEMEK